MQLKKKHKIWAKIFIIYIAILFLVLNRNSIFYNHASNFVTVRQEIIRILFENQVFLIDIDTLSQIYRSQSNEHKLNLDLLSKATFGIYSENINTFKNEVIASLF